MENRWELNLVGWRWMEVGGSGWEWVGARFSITLLSEFLSVENVSHDILLIRGLSKDLPCENITHYIFWEKSPVKHLVWWKCSPQYFSIRDSLKSFVWKKIFFNGILRRNIEHFLKKTIWEKLGITEMKYLKNTLFFFFNRLYFWFL